MARMRNEERYEAQRTRILAESARIFRDRGYSQTSMEDLATALGVTKAAIYYYYKRKEEILFDICDQALEFAYETTIVTDSSMGAKERLERFVRGGVASIAENMAGDERAAHLELASSASATDTRRIQKDVLERAAAQAGLRGLSARDADGAVTFVGAAAGADAPFPTAIAGVITASGTEQQPRAGALGAPAQHVLTLRPGGEYDFESGSSVAAAEITAVMALLMSASPTKLSTATLVSLLSGPSVVQAAALQANTQPPVDVNAALARLEGRVALEELLKRIPEWDVDTENARLASTSTVRGWESLPVVVPHDEIGFLFFDGPRRWEAAARTFYAPNPLTSGHLQRLD